MGIYAGLYLPIENELHQLVLQCRNRPVKCSGHASHVRAQIWTEILYERPIAYLRVKCIDVRCYVHIQQNVVFDLVEQFQTRRVLRFVKFENDVPQLRLQFQKQFERTAKNYLLLQLVSANFQKFQ